MNILIGKIGHETNVFSSEAGTFERWTHNEWAVGEDIVPLYTDKADYLSGMLRAAQEGGAQIISTVAVLDAGPLLERQALDYVLDQLLAKAAQHKDELDGICLGLHGAGCAQGCDSIEVYILSRIREIVGDTLPIAVTLDLHGNLPDELAALATGLFGVKQYPHVDMEEAGHLAMASLIRHIDGRATMRTALVRLPLLVAPPMGCTLEQPMLGFTEHVARYARNHGLIDATFFHGFPYSDVPHCGASVVVVSERDPVPTARELAQYVWDNRDKLIAESLSVQQAVERAQRLAIENPGRYIVINETSDNPGGGAPCDGTWLLAELIRQNVPRAIVAYIHDTEIALAAHNAGVGGQISGALGAKTDTLHGSPICLENAVVCALSDGIIDYRSPMIAGMTAHYGRSARLRIGQVEVIVTENLAQQTFDDAPIAMLGTDIEDYRLVGVKSSNHFKAFFTSRAAAIVTADPPGIHTANFAQLPYKRISRPIYPLDRESVFANP